MIFSREAIAILQHIGLDPGEVDRDPIDSGHRQRLEDAFFCHGGLPEPSEQLVAELLNKERLDGWHVYRPSEIHLDIPDESRLCAILTNRYRSMLILMQEIFGAETASPIDFERQLICIPSSRQDAYVYTHGDTEYIVLCYGLVALMRATGESLLLVRWFETEPFIGPEKALVKNLLDRMSARLPFAILAAPRRREILPWLGASLSSYEYLDSCCCLGFALYFVCAHEAVHIAHRHSTLLDPLSAEYSEHSSVRRFCEAFSISAHQALELVADEHATYYVDAIDAWSNLSFGVAAYILATGLARLDNREKLRLAYVRSDNLASQHLGEGSPSTFGIGAVAISEVASYLESLTEEDSTVQGQMAPDASTLDAAWSDFIDDFRRLFRYLVPKLSIAYSQPFEARKAPLAAAAKPVDSPKPLVLRFHDEQPYQSLQADRDGIRVAIEHVRVQATSNPEAKPLLGALLGDLAQSLIKDGSPHDAIDPAREAVSIFRSLSQQDQDPGTRLMLALSLTGLGSALANKLRHERAAGVFERKKIHALRQRMSALRAAVDQDDLAVALKTMADDFRQLQGGSERLASNEEAVAILTDLCEREPGKYDGQLGGSLVNLAANLEDMGRSSEARTRMLEAIAKFRAIHTREPRIKLSLAQALLAHAVMCTKGGDRDPTIGITSAEEAKALYAELAQGSGAVFAREYEAINATLVKLKKSEL